MWTYVFPTSIDLTVAGEGGVRDLAVDGVILSGHAGHGLLQHGDVGVVGAEAAGVVAEGASVAAAGAVLRLGAVAVVVHSVGRLRS